jgi:serine/threonine protein kinase
MADIETIEVLSNRVNRKRKFEFIVSKIRLSDGNFAVKRVFDNKLHYENELKALQILSEYPNFPKVISHQDLGDGYFELVVKFVPGLDLFQLIFCNNNTMTNVKPVFVKQVFVQFLKLVELMHSKGIVHNDLKIENVIVEITRGSENIWQGEKSDLWDFHVYIIDFEFVQFLDELPGGKSKLSVGTVIYFSPEKIMVALYYEEFLLLKNRQYCPISNEIWCIGVMLYLLFESNRAPFSEKYLLQDALHIFPVEFDPNLSTESEISLYKQLLSGIWELKPEHRPSLTQISKHSFFQ